MTSFELCLFLSSHHHIFSSLSSLLQKKKKKYLSTAVSQQGHMTESAICDDHPRLIRTLQSPSIHWGRTGGLCSRNVLGVFCLPPSCPHSDFGTITGRVKAAVAYPPAVFAFANHSVDIVKITGSHISKVGANNGSAPLGSLQT